eukprot:1784943-Pyramimonas_sp.AAC.1
MVSSFWAVPEFDFRVVNLDWTGLGWTDWPHGFSDRCMFGGRGRNLWRNQWGTLGFQAAEGATHGATNGRRPYSLRPGARTVAQPIGN